MRSVSTLLGRAKRAKAFADEYLTSQGGFWICVGKTTEWPVEDTPPIPAPYLLKMPEVYGFWYVHMCELVYADITGSVITPSGRFSVIQDRSNVASIAAAYGTRVYIESLIKPTDLDPVIKYRALGLCTNVTFNSVLPVLQPGAFVLASQVSSYFLDWIATFTAIERAPDTDHKIQIVREF